jgi:hypothetical protein
VQGPFLGWTFGLMQLTELDLSNNNLQGAVPPSEHDFVHASNVPELRGLGCGSLPHPTQAFFPSQTSTTRRALCASTCPTTS